MVSYFVDDLDTVFAFYHNLLGWSEMEHRTDAFRGLADEHGVQLGFHGVKAYSLLDVKRPNCLPHAAPSVLTLEVGEEADVVSSADRANELGGYIVKAPYRTFYGVWQVVLGDPEGNLLRINYRYAAY